MIIAFAFALSAIAFATLYSHSILYALAAVVSLVGINIHFGVTLYLSRIVIIIFIFSVFIRLASAQGLRVPVRFLSVFFSLFGLILLFQFVSVAFSSQFTDGLRQIFILLSLMFIFTATIISAKSIDIIINALKIYLTIGLVQGLYGIYMVVGGPYRWPTYQTLMEGIPTANDHTVGGYFYYSAYDTYRALGFFPADMSHYAGYMAGVLLLAIAFIVFDRKCFLPYLVLLFGGVGLILSLSRSGIIAFIVFGLPTLFFLLSRVRPSRTRGVMRSLMLPGALAAIILGVIGPFVLTTMDIKLPNAVEIVSTRLDDILSPGKSNKESMSEHIATKLAGLDAFVSSPLIGVGLGVNASPWHSETYNRGWGGSHSHHLDMLGQTGLIGAGLQFLFMMMVGRYMWRGLFVTSENSLARHLLAGLLAAYVAIIFGNLLYHYFLLDFVWFLMGIGVALSRLLIVETKKEELLLSTAFSPIQLKQHRT